MEIVDAFLRNIYKRLSSNLIKQQKRLAAEGQGKVEVGSTKGPTAAIDLAMPLERPLIKNYRLETYDARSSTPLANGLANYYVCRISLCGAVIIRGKG